MRDWTSILSEFRGRYGKIYTRRLCVMEISPGIEVNGKKRFGKPVIKGTRKSGA
jgi:hypothetical protein